MVFDVNSITNGENAINVLGQATFTTNTLALTATSMKQPKALIYDDANNYLYITEYGNSRITIQDVTPATISNGQSASYVLGKPDFTTGFINSNSQTNLVSPVSLTYDPTNKRIFVSQQSGAVLVFDVNVISNGEAAINILGTASYTLSISDTLTINGISRPDALLYDTTNNYLYVGQGANSNRLSIFNVTTITNNENAIDLLGQDDGTSLTNPVPVYTKGDINNGPNKLGFNSPYATTTDTTNHRFFVSDYNNNRVLVYNLNADNTFPDRVPDNVLGQSSFLTNTAARTQSGMSYPKGLTYDSTNNRLFVSEPAICRIMIYDVTTITNGEAAINVLGQSSFTTGTCATTQSGLNAPQGLAYNNTNNQLYIADAVNRRILVHNVNPATITNGQNADYVLGQPDFTTATSQTTQSGFKYPLALTYDPINQRLFVIDRLSHRVMVYDLTTITNGENAINVLGQTDFISSTYNTFTATTSTFKDPTGIAFDHITNRLFVGSTQIDRVMIFDTTTIINGEAAIGVLGIPTLVAVNPPALPIEAKLNEISALSINTDNNRLYVSQSTSANRISIFDIGTPTLILTESDGTTAISEGVTTDSFTMVLTAQPASNVVFNITSSQSTAASPSSPTITFTSTNWNMPQTVTITAPEENNAIDETPTITITIDTNNSDPNFTIIPTETVSVAVTDNDTAGITLTESDGTTAATEGETDTYTLVLTSEPTSDVTIDISVDDQVSVDLSALTFTSGNWNVAQTVTVTAVDDREVEEEHTGTISHTVSSVDGDYDVLVVGDVVMTITDNDRRGGGTTYFGGPIIVTPTSCTITSPNGGEKWLAGSTHAITWTTAGTGIDNLVLYYRVDTSRDWTTIYAGTRNTGSFSWTLPNISSQNVYIKADCRDSGAATLARDESNSAFTIVPEVTTPEVVPPIRNLPTREEANLVLPQNFPVDSLVKLTNDGNEDTQIDSAVYYIGLDAKRHAFPNGQIYFSWYRDFSLVQEIDTRTLASIPLGSSVLTRPGTYWVKIQSDPKTYFVSPGYVLHWIQDETAAMTLGGTNWNQRIMDIDPSLFAHFTVGNSISAADLAISWPEGSLMKEVGTNNLYYIDSEGKRFITSNGFITNNFQYRFLRQHLPMRGGRASPLRMTSQFSRMVFSRSW